MKPKKEIFLKKNIKEIHFLNIGLSSKRYNHIKQSDNCLNFISDKGKMVEVSLKFNKPSLTPIRSFFLPKEMVSFNPEAKHPLTSIFV